MLSLDTKEMAMHRASLVVLFPVLLAGAQAASAQAPAVPDASASDNVSITLTVGRVGGTAPAGEKTYKFVGQDGKPARMLMGWRTPIPTRSSDQGQSDASATSYVYQNIGMTADLQTRSVGKTRYSVMGQIEISGTRDGAGAAAAAAAAAAPPGKPPLIGTFNQALNVVVSLGKKVRIAEVPDPEGGSLYIDLRVDLLE